MKYYNITEKEDDHEEKNSKNVEEQTFAVDIVTLQDIGDYLENEYCLENNYNYYQFTNPTSIGQTMKYVINTNSFEYITEFVPDSERDGVIFINNNIYKCVIEMVLSRYSDVLFVGPTVLSNFYSWSPLILFCSSFDPLTNTEDTAAA